MGDIHFYDWTSNSVIDHVSIAVAYLADGATLVDAHNVSYYHTRYDFGVSYDPGVTYYMDRMHDTISNPL